MIHSAFCRWKDGEKKNWQTDSESEGVVPERIAGVNGRLFIYSALILCRFDFIFTPSHESQKLYLWTHVGFAGHSSHAESKHTSARAYSADYVTNGSSFWSSASHCYFIYLIDREETVFFVVMKVSMHGKPANGHRAQSGPTSFDHSPPLPEDVYRSSFFGSDFGFKVNCVNEGAALSRQVFSPRGKANYWSGGSSRCSKFYLSSSKQHSTQNVTLTREEQTRAQEQREVHLYLLEDSIIWSHIYIIWLLLQPAERELSHHTVHRHFA